MSTSPEFPKTHLSTFPPIHFYSLVHKCINGWAKGGYATETSRPPATPTIPQAKPYRAMPSHAKAMPSHTTPRRICRRRNSLPSHSVRHTQVMKSYAPFHQNSKSKTLEPRLHHMIGHRCAGPGLRKLLVYRVVGENKRKLFCALCASCRFFGSRPATGCFWKYHTHATRLRTSQELNMPSRGAWVDCELKKQSLPSSSRNGK